ncbi:MAG TPA: VCBS repeat-containing protein [Anaerolineaceae bacterium]|nr:VCBS repeat-containing protein [Anaerolineaceae bacterium]
MFAKTVKLIVCLLALTVMLGACQPQVVATPAPSITVAAPQPTAIPPSPRSFVLSTFVDSGQDLGQGDGTGIVAGDVDGDGDIDAFVSEAVENSQLLLNDGTGKFTLSDQEFKPGSSAAFGDLNGDKSLDIFLTEERSNEIWLNNGKGLFSKSDQSLASPESSAVALGDLDSDGDLDAFVTNWNGQPDQVFINDGSGNFTDSGQKLGNWFGTAVSLGDVENDGDLDALVANNGESTDNAPVLWLNDGTGVFTDSTQRLGFTNAYAAVLGDLDADGDLDAFIANSNHNGARPPDKVWMNDGKGIYTDSGQSLGTYYSLTAALADLDGDGDLDAVTGCWRSSLKIWLNGGKGTFTESEIKLVSFNSSGVAIADMDGDGDLDMFVSTNTWSSGNGRHKLWLNQPEP